MDILVTGAAGVVGAEVCGQLRAGGHRPVQVVRRPSPDQDVLAWDMGRAEPPESVRRHWDVIVHAAASTRWTMSRAEATASNIDPLRAALALAGPDTHVVHVSTAYVDHGDDVGAGRPEYDGYRNGYEWSKARCEALVRERGSATTIVRPPLILGRRSDGGVARFSGAYTLLQTLVSGLAALVVGEPEGYAEIAPVDEVAEVIVAAALGPVPADVPVEVIAAGADCLKLDEMLDIILDGINEWRTARGTAPVPRPPMMPADRWHRFCLPLVHEYLSPVQAQAVELLSLFEGYTSMSKPFTPTVPVRDPAEVLRRSVAHWVAAKPQLAGRTPEPWSLVP
ncbi:SDR family oxidoreductase [Streptomyces sp. CRN 30]|uniref:SDR family oxidoreductase n=1 Tax=Streptomyces sp. CRN 30 TaxID=3075613 RepID=UPI002A80A19E|nr:SDR family oxidoreductase [Streptomyces sp. CRN 30]